MKKSRQWFSTLLFCLSFILFSHTTSTRNLEQRIDRHIIMFKIDRVSTFEEAEKIDADMRTKAGILASRTNPENSIYFCFSLAKNNLTEADFTKWFKDMGYSISCFDKVVEGEGISMSYEEFENCKK